MDQIIITNLSQPSISPVKARFCESFRCRLRGLTFRRSLVSQEGLLLVQKKDSRVEASIHMLAVFMDLAIVWINTDGDVVDSRLARRWRPIYVPQKPARYVLEMAPDRLADFKVGDKVKFEEIRLD
jgi:uncharacterized membrane protein (UPF0127 family)